MRNYAISQDLIKLGNRIQDRRQEMNLSQEKVAEKADINANTVSHIESRHSAMSIEIFMKLVQILDKDANELLGLDALAAEEDRQNKEMICRIRDLKQCEQRVVLHTLDVLVDGLKHKADD